MDKKKGEMGGEIRDGLTVANEHTKNRCLIGNGAINAERGPIRDANFPIRRAFTIAQKRVFCLKMDEDCNPIMINRGASLSSNCDDKIDRLEWERVTDGLLLFLKNIETDRYRHGTVLKHTA